MSEMAVVQLEAPKEEAYKKWREYRVALKTHKEAYLNELSDAYYQLSRGRKVLDLEESFRLAGLNAEGLPRLGISLADERVVILRCRPSGAFEFQRRTGGWQKPMATVRGGVVVEAWGKHDYKHFTAAVPLVPPEHLPKGQLSGYHLLWEVESWTPEPPRDPMLLKKISRNLFAVMAQWDLTELRRSVMRSTFTPRP